MGKTHLGNVSKYLVRNFNRNHTVHCECTPHNYQTHCDIYGALYEQTVATKAYIPEAL